MKIIEITQNKKNYIDLLLLADEQEDMIDRYLDRGRMFVLDDDGIKAECVITEEGPGVLEIKNLATDPNYQKQGYGKTLIQYVEALCKGKYHTLLVGIGDSPLTVPFYKKCGFKESYRVKNFFTDNYDHPIIEEGVQLVDMVYFEKYFPSEEYRLPTLEDERMLREYVEEHFEAGEQEISASMMLTSMDYKEWVEMIHQNVVTPNGDWGKSQLLLCMSEGELVGLLSVRYDLTKEYRQMFGDIGYGVRPSKRCQGFATKMLYHGLRVCKEQGMSDVILGCYKDNLPSVKTILKNNGELFLESPFEDGKIAQYYRINLLQDK